MLCIVPSCPGGGHCRDGSDQAHCWGRRYTGCLLASERGLVLGPCSRCACTLAAADNNTLALGSLGPVCLPLASPRLCDGVPDCEGGTDERRVLCNHRCLTQG